MAQRENNDNNTDIQDSFKENVEKKVPSIPGRATTVTGLEKMF